MASLVSSRCKIDGNDRPIDVGVIAALYDLGLKDRLLAKLSGKSKDRRIYTSMCVCVSVCADGR
jgi:hypothetical protein